MLFRRLFAGLFVLAFLAGVTLPAVAQEKDKDKDKAKDKDKDKDKDAKKDDKDKKDDKGVLLAWKFDKDKAFYQKMETKTTQKMKVMNNDVVQTQKQTFYFKWRPTKTDEKDKVTIE